MKLFFKKIGEGKPLIILHGLFGLSDNWMTLAKQFAENNFTCYIVDQRNHGRSPHSPEFSYPLMAEDLFELMKNEKIDSASFIGHSMGGKTAMFFGGLHSDRTDKLVVVDIAPRYYTPHHDSVLSALSSVDLNNNKTRKDVEAQLRLSLHEESTVQFLLKNLYWVEDAKDESRGTRDEGRGTLDEGREKRLAWRFNLDAIEKNIKEVGESLPENLKFNKPVLFVRGEKSGYITDQDQPEIKKHFPNALISTIPGAGHWVHAENPTGFMEVVLEFLHARENKSN